MSFSYNAHNISYYVAMSAYIYIIIIYIYIYMLHIVSPSRPRVLRELLRVGWGWGQGGVMTFFACDMLRNCCVTLAHM